MIHLLQKLKLCNSVCLMSIVINLLQKLKSCNNVYVISFIYHYDLLSLLLHICFHFFFSHLFSSLLHIYFHFFFYLCFHLFFIFAFIISLYFLSLFLLYSPSSLLPLTQFCWHLSAADNTILIFQHNKPILHLSYPLFHPST